MYPIKLTEAMKLQILKDIKAKLETTTAHTTKLDISYSLVKAAEKRITVAYTASAFLKMCNLIQHCEKEIGWHGVVDRVSGDTFIIKDILVYPQAVTGATITADEEEYAKWKMQLNDEQYNKLRYFGHSHVNMMTSPSGVDLNVQDNYTQTLNDTDYYIFSINNKKGDHWIQIFDKVTNMCYETKDIDIVYIDDANHSINDWATSEIKNKLTEFKPTIKPKQFDFSEYTAYDYPEAEMALRQFKNQFYERNKYYGH